MRTVTRPQKKNVELPDQIDPLCYKAGIEMGIPIIPFPHKKILPRVKRYKCETELFELSHVVTAFFFFRIQEYTWLAFIAGKAYACVSM